MKVNEGYSKKKKYKEENDKADSVTDLYISSLSRIDSELSANITYCLPNFHCGKWSNIAT